MSACSILLSLSLSPTRTCWCIFLCMTCPFSLSEKDNSYTAYTPTSLVDDLLFSEQLRVAAATALWPTGIFLFAFYYCIVLRSSHSPLAWINYSHSAKIKTNKTSELTTDPKNGFSYYITFIYVTAPPVIFQINDVETWEDLNGCNCDLFYVYGAELLFMKQSHIWRVKRTHQKHLFCTLARFSW